MSSIFSLFSSSPSPSSPSSHGDTTSCCQNQQSRERHKENISSSTKKRDEAIELAGDLIRGAVAAEKKSLDEALSLYTAALDIWVGLLRDEKDQVRKEELGCFVEKYMKRAEEIKAAINSADEKYKNNALRKITPTARKVSQSCTAHTASSRQRIRNHEHSTLRKSEGFVPKTKQTESNEYESQMLAEMLDTSPGVRWDDISGLDHAKKTIHEAVVMPNMRPDLFSGLRSPPKGVLFYGPPGTGKTMLAKAIATESGFNFFSISSSSVTSKFLGEGEKLMKAVFDLARKKQPSVIFFDEIDALLSSRKENEHEASRRLKTEFMVQLDGASSNPADRILVVGATNIPWEIDEAVLRRMVKRIYVPLPEAQTRFQLISQLVTKQEQSCGRRSKLSESSLKKIVNKTQGYSASDLTALCKEAAMGPIREIPSSQFSTVKVENLRPISEADFMAALRQVRPSVSQASLGKYNEWSAQFGTLS